MTVTLLKKLYHVDTNDIEELYILAKQAQEDGHIGMSQYASLRANISGLLPQPLEQRRTISRYTEEEVLAVTKSYLDVYDGFKNEEAHLNLMKSMFSENSSHYRNGIQYCRSFKKTLDLGSANLGQSMPANWANATMLLIQNRPDKKANVLKACRTIYESTNNGNMYHVIQRWS